MSDAPDLRAAALASKAWPYEEARKLLKRWPDGKPAGGPVIFETGYGPSGLPHIGTFNEVARTTFVRHAYEELTGSADAADRVQRRHGRAAQGPGQRPEPGDAGRESRQAADANPRPVRHARKLRAPQQCDAPAFPRPLRLRLRIPLGDRLLHDAAASTRSIRKVLQGWDAIMGVMLPTLREDRRKTYSPVLPISPTSGRVLQVPVEVIDAEAGLIAFDDEDGAASSNRRSAAWPSCSGRSTGRRAGSRSGSITKCRARI